LQRLELEREADPEHRDIAFGVKVHEWNPDSMIEWTARVGGGGNPRLFQKRDHLIRQGGITRASVIDLIEVIRKASEVMLNGVA
jgi:hypothetical protein